jgi:polyisoprenoid-binding protein YceI
MKKSLLTITAVSLLIGGHVHAGESGLGTAKPGSYKVESYHTQVGFSLSHFGFTNYSGLFSGATGSLQLNPAKLGASKLDISIPVDSVTTTVSKLTDELKGDQWFDTAKFPKATFVSTQVVPTAEGATVTGNFTLHGITKPVVLHVRFIGAGVNPIDKAYTVGFEATGTIKRSDFGVKTYLPAVGDEVQLSIAGAFEQQA